VTYIALVLLCAKHSSIVATGMAVGIMAVGIIFLHILTTLESSFNMCGHPLWHNEAVLLNKLVLYA